MIRQRPSKEELEEKYKELRSTLKLGEFYRISSQTALNWLNDYGIEVRKSNQQISKEIKPSKEELEARLKGLGSLSKIARFYKISITTADKWIEKEGIYFKKREQKPKRFYKDMSKKQWLAYGMNEGYNSLTRSELNKKENEYYQKGRKEGWLAELIPETKHKPDGFYSDMGKEQWIIYGKENGYDELTRTELSRIHSAYSLKGRKENWIEELIPGTKVKPNGFYSNMTKEQWLAYGIENGFDKLKRTQLARKSCQYLLKGESEGWLEEMITPAFTKMTKKQWLKYGFQNKLYCIGRKELNEKHPGFYRKGWREGWIDELIHKKNSLEQQLDDYAGK